MSHLVRRSDLGMIDRKEEWVRRRTARLGAQSYDRNEMIINLISVGMVSSVNVVGWRGCWTMLAKFGLGDGK